MRKLGYVLIVSGAAINVVDALTQRTDIDRSGYYGTGRSLGGLMYGEGGLLKPINDALPINLGLGVMLVGAGILCWRLIR